MLILRRKSRIFLGIIFCILFNNCSQKSFKYYYAIYGENSTNPEAYMVKRIYIEDSFRKDLTYYYSLGFELKIKVKEDFKITKHAVYKINSQFDSIVFLPYLTIANKNCVKYEFGEDDIDSVMSTEFCFIGIKKIVNVEYKFVEAYEFLKTTGNKAGVKAKVYMDKNLILLKEEYLSGYMDNYRIERLEIPPAKLKKM